MKKARVPIFGKPNSYVTVAVDGEIILGRDVRWPDGRIVQPSEVLTPSDNQSDVEDAIDAHTAQLIAAQQEIDRVAAESVERDLKAALAAAADAEAKATAAREAAFARAQQLMADAVSKAAIDATIKANGARDIALARANVVAAQVADILEADMHDVGRTYPQGDLVQWSGGLYRALQDVPAGRAITDTVYWERVGDYTSLGEAVSASITKSTQTATELALERSRLSGIAARMPAGTGGLATQAMVADEASIRAAADESLAHRTTVVEARMPSGSGKLATEASVTAAESASVSRDNALSSRVTVVEARMPSGSGKLATEASVTAAESASVSRDNALSSRVTVVEARMPTGSGKLATAASVSAASAASASATAAVADRVTVVEARMPSGAGKLATEARVSAVESAAADANAATAARATQLEARIGGRVDNLAPQAHFEAGRGVWTVGTVVDAVGHPSLTRALSATTSPYLPAAYNFDAAPGEVFDLRIDAKPASATAQIAANIQWLDKSGAIIGYASSGARGVRNTQDWVIGHTTTGHVAPAGAVHGRIGVSMTGGGGMFTNLVVTRRTTGMAALDARITEVADAAATASGAVATRTTVLEARASAIERNTEFAAARVWGFDSTSEGWTERDGSAWTTPQQIDGGLIRLYATISKPLMLLSPLLLGAQGIDGKKYPYLQMRIRTSHGRAAHNLAIYFQADSKGISETTRVNFDVAAGTGWQTITVDMGSNFYWLTSPVRRIRIDKFGCHIGDDVEIDYIAIGSVGVGMGADALAKLDASITNVESASVARDGALSDRITTAEAKSAAAQAAATLAQQAVASETSARAAAIIGVRSELSGGGNLLRNTGFERNLAGWALDWNEHATPNVQVTRNLGGLAWTPAGGAQLGVRVPGTLATDHRITVASDAVQVRPGQRYCVVAALANRRCHIGLGIEAYDGQGNKIHGPVEWKTNQTGGGENINNWQRPHFFYTMPANARTARVILWVRGIGQANAHAWMTQPMLCAAAADQTAPPVYLPGGNEQAAAVLELKTELDANTATTNAIWGLSSNVNGLIDGMRSVNNGVRSTISFLTSAFRVVSNVLNGAGMEWQDGYLRIYATTVQMILGFSFGADNDLVFYYGPNVGAGEARKNNATIWFDKLGGAYFGGQLSSGVLHTAERRNYSTLAPGENSRLTIVHLNSSGRRKMVNISATWGGGVDNSFATHHEAQTYYNSKPPVTGTVIWRVLRNGVEIWRDSVTATSTRSGPDFLDTVPPQWVVSIDHHFAKNATITDTFAGTGNVTYQLEVVGSSGQFRIESGMLGLRVTEE